MTAIFLNSCDDSSDDPDLCTNSPELSVDNVIASVDGQSTGEVVVSASEGTGPYMYRIDGGNFQSSNTFSNVAGGTYTVEVKDANDCTDDESVEVPSVPEVSYANEIRPIIDTNCQISNCHGSNPNLVSFETYADVKANASGIKTRTGNGSMPPSGPLPNQEIELIANWVDQGAPEN